jgi:hypothetical protein
MYSAISGMKSLEILMDHFDQLSGLSVLAVIHISLLLFSSAEIPEWEGIVKAVHCQNHDAPQDAHP